MLLRASGRWARNHSKRRERLSDRLRHPEQFHAWQARGLRRRNFLRAQLKLRRPSPELLQWRASRHRVQSPFDRSNRFLFVFRFVKDRLLCRESTRRSSSLQVAVLRPFRPFPPIRSACPRAIRRNVFSPPTRTFQTCPGRFPDFRCKSTNPPSSVRTWSNPFARADGIHPSSTIDQRGSSWQSTRAARIRESEKLQQPCPTAPEESRHSRDLEDIAQSLQTRANLARLFPCHRTQSTHQVFQLRQDQDCSSACGAPLLDASPCN